mmetsp:Transcript_22835/g.58145  ORF Transcript_22835/g.58145 Transcript_22835/m.58145 type:complete len:250 (-) Transcript_22835:1750-2499(-)
MRPAGSTHINVYGRAELGQINGVPTSTKCLLLHVTQPDQATCGCPTQPHTYAHPPATLSHTNGPTLHTPVHTAFGYVHQTMRNDQIKPTPPLFGRQQCFTSCWSLLPLRLRQHSFIYIRRPSLHNRILKSLHVRSSAQHLTITSCMHARPHRVLHTAPCLESGHVSQDPDQSSHAIRSQLVSTCHYLPPGMPRLLNAPGQHRQRTSPASPHRCPVFSATPPPPLPLSTKRQRQQQPPAFPSTSTRSWPH